MSAQLPRERALNCAELRAQNSVDSAQFGGVKFLRNFLVNCAQHRQSPRSSLLTSNTLRSEGPHTVPPWGWGTCGGQAEGKSRTQARIRAGGVMARDMTADVLREVLRMRGCKAPMSAINTAAELIALGEWSRGSRPWFDALERAADRLMLQYGADRLPGYLWAQYVAGRVAP